MHRSRLFGLFVDTPVADASAAVSFWSHALGGTPVRGAADDPYVAIDGASEALRFEVQAVADTPRYHVDIETDDVAAETARLIGLGATVHAQPEGYTVLRAPGGHLVCVVPVQSAPEYFAAHARTW